MTSGSAPGEPDPGVADLDARRRAHREEERRRSEQVVVVLPDTEGEVAAVLGRLEELLLADLDAEDEPVIDAPPEAARAVGRLASNVAAAERAAAVQPVAPDGRYELVPLNTVAIAHQDLGHILEAVAGVARAGAALRSWWGEEVEAAGFVAATQRLGALLSLPWDDDVDVLDARLGDAGGAGPVGAVLSAAEYAAYQRVSGRIFKTRHAGDPLAPFLYGGR